MSAPRHVHVWHQGALAARHDVLATEEPLEIRVNGEPVSITMRTPGHDWELAAGFLHGEGLIGGRADLRATGPVVPGAGPANVVDLPTVRAIDPERLERHFYATSSCGVCGKASLKALEVLAEPVAAAWRVAPTTLLTLPDRLRAAQATFEATGSLHAAGLFDRLGVLVAAYEDVGRHNAVDKAIGSRLLAGAMPLDETILLVSGRPGFEIVQKAVMARIPVVAGISGPSSLAVDLAERFGVTLVGFLRGSRFNVYAHPERLAQEDPPP